jgi:hypothetical protein
MNDLRYLFKCANCEEETVQNVYPQRLFFEYRGYVAGNSQIPVRCTEFLLCEQCAKPACSVAFDKRIEVVSTGPSLYACFVRDVKDSK